MKKLIFTIAFLLTLTSYAGVSPEKNYHCVAVNSADKFSLIKTDMPDTWKVKTTLKELMADGKTALWFPSYQKEWEDKMIEIRVLNITGTRFFVTPYKKTSKNGVSYFSAYVGSIVDINAGANNLKKFRCN